MTATLCTWEPILRKPLVFDVDDAIFLGPRGSNSARIARSASLIICGNSFLANHFSRHGPVAILPTAVDTSRFVPRTTSLPQRPVIGWSGSSSGFKYLYDIEPAIDVVLRRHPDSLLKIVADKAPAFKSLPADRVVFERWHPDREAAVLQEFSLGIMPLHDDPWARGKCSFKMLTYMSAGLPVVVSPVGMNAEVLAKGACGLGAKTADDWVGAMSMLLSDPSLGDQMGRAGRQIVEAHYARNIVAPQLAQLLRGQM